MGIPSFSEVWEKGERTKPRIMLLVVHDRDRAGDDPIARIIVEREESYRRSEEDQSVYSATIRMSYSFVAETPRFANDSGDFSGHYSHGYLDGPSVSLTSGSFEEGAIFLDPESLRGKRVGTYLMNEIVKWARQWPEAKVRPIKLLAWQAEDENKARRNRFYEQFGIKFEYSDPNQCEGISLAMFASDLTPVETWRKNIREMDIGGGLSELLYQQQQVGYELSQRSRAINALTDEIKDAESRPIVGPYSKFGGVLDFPWLLL